MAEGPAPVQVVLNDLPDECLIGIFQYVPITDVAESVSLVCRRWRRLCLDEGLWRTVSINLEPWTRKALAMAPCLDKLCLDIGWVSGRRRGCIKKIPERVKRLDVYISDGDFSAMGRLLERTHRNLKELRIRAERHTGWSGGRADLDRFFENFAKCANLQLFDTDDGVITYLARDGRRALSCPSAKLREIVVGATGGVGLMASLLCPLIREHANSLYFIELNGMPFADDMPLLGSAIGSCKLLRRAVLRYCTGVALLKECPSLVSLTLIEHWQGLPNFEEAAELINAPKVQSKLQFLYLYGDINCDLRMLRNTPLRSLVYGCPLIQSGFFEGLRGLRSLEVLKLEHMECFTDDIMEATINACPRLKTLRVASHRNLCNYECFKLCLERVRKKHADRLEIEFPYRCTCSSSTSPTA